MTGLTSTTAIGLGGQMMHIFPEHGLIIIVTCDSDDLATPRYDTINTFIQNKILNLL